MDILQLVSDVHYLAVGIAAVASMLVGMIWYHPRVFGNLWRKECTIEGYRMPVATLWHHGGALVANAITAIILAILVGGAGLIQGMTLGLLIGVGIVVAQHIVAAIYEHRSWRYILIQSGYIIVLFVVLGSIIGSTEIYSIVN